MMRDESSMYIFSRAGKQVLIWISVYHAWALAEVVVSNRMDINSVWESTLGHVFQVNLFILIERSTKCLLYISLEVFKKN